MPASRNFLRELFAIAENDPRGIPVEMRLFRKGGQPFLLLPRLPHAAALSLDLYPAQTPRARLAKAFLRQLVRFSAPFGAEDIQFTIAPADPFLWFLGSLAGERSPASPTFGVLAGNPASDGQRFLFLVINADQTPVAVVKAGLSDRAKALIEWEESFLTKAAGKPKGVPRLRATFQSPRLRALALDFFSGDSPGSRHEGVLPSLLTSWVDVSREMPLSDTPDWERLELAASANQNSSRLLRRLRERKIHPAIHHGDFAPWNVKVSASGEWTVLDWERGELTGIPAWDWFHYVVQPAILVQRLTSSALVQRLEELLASVPFKQYADLAGLAGCERELLQAYLLHVLEVIKPSEGLGATRELAAALSTRWKTP
jgi:hypothetical protein